MTDVPIERRVIEERLIEAFRDARRTVEPNRDLFARVNRSIADAAARRRWRIRLALGLTTFVLLLGALALALSDVNNGRITMEWWTIELITNIVLVSIAIGLGPFIKRFGRAYAADVFRANPRTGKSYLVLTDVAYYLIFTSFILFTVTFVAPSGMGGIDRRTAQGRGRPGRRDPAHHGDPPRAERRRPPGDRPPAVAQQAARRRWDVRRSGATATRASVGDTARSAPARGSSASSPRRKSDGSIVEMTGDRRPTCEPPRHGSC